MAAKNDSLKNQSAPGKNGGARPGAGRPKGVQSVETRRRAAALEAYKKRVRLQTQRLLDAQMTMAMGVTTLWRIPKVVEERKNKDGEVVNSRERNGKPEIVTSQRDVEKYLAGDFDNDPKADYYFITTDKPDNRALDSLLDRTYGKATQPLSGDPEDPDGPKIGLVLYRPEKLPDDYDTKPNN